MNTEVSAADVPRILERQFPNLGPVRAAYLGCGMDSVVYEVNERWIFRFPMRPVVERQLVVERALLPEIASRLPIRIPAFACWGTPSAEFPMHFVGYEKLSGPTAVEIDQSLVNFDALAPQFGAFLSALHAVPVAEAKRLGVEVSRVVEDWEVIRRDAIASLQLVPPITPDAPIDSVRRYLERLDPMREPPWPATLVHQDLGAEHVLLDASGTRVTGVIDWGDVAITDPSIDFVGLYAWGGERFVRATLRHYHGPLDERVLDRVRPWAMFKVAQDVRFGLDTGQPAIVRMAIEAMSTV